MDLEAIAQAVSAKLNERDGYNSFEEQLWDDGAGDEFRHYFITGTRNAAAWLSITLDGITLHAKIRNDKSFAGSVDENGRSVGSWRNHYRNALSMAKRAAARAARGDE